MLPTNNAFIDFGLLIHEIMRSVVLSGGFQNGGHFQMIFQSEKQLSFYLGVRFPRAKKFPFVEGVPDAPNLYFS